MEKQQLIEKIRSVTDRQSLLDLLNEVKRDMLGDKYHPFTMRMLMLLCNPRIVEICHYMRYRMFVIPKKSGGYREIFAPRGNLKWMQKCLNEIFSALYTPSAYAMGFAQGRNVVDNARYHTNQNYVFNIDLSDFFPSIDQARVWRRLQLAPFNFNKDVASVIAGLCAIKSRRTTDEGTSECYNLPQGAPTSPILTNAICDTLDRRLAGLAKRFGLHYSRYADDITFSSMHNVYQEGSDFRKELERIITDQHFAINSKKTRLHHRGERQEVTGLTVSEKVNVARGYVKDVRALLHIWKRYGYNAAVAAFYPRYKSEKGYLHPGDPNLQNVISGKLCYLKMVKGESDPVYCRLAEQFVRLNAEVKASQTLERSWEYITTETIPEFEKRLGVQIKYARAKSGKQFAYFDIKGERLFISISQNLSIRQLPNDIQISFCVKTDFKVRFDPYFYISPSKLATLDSSTVLDRVALDCPKPGDLGQRCYYLIHRPLKANSPRRIIVKDNVAEDFKQEVIQIARQCPQLGLKDDLGIIESANKKDTLARLVESGFDLSILP